MDVAKLKEEWSGFEFDTAEFKVTEDSILGFARACGETDPRFVDPAHPDFQAPVNYTSRYVGRRILPENFPSLSRRGFDAGKCVEVHGPVRPGDTLTARSQIADIFEKTGRSGPMVFIVHRMEFTNQSGQHVSTVDWRMVQQPEKKS